MCDCIETVNGLLKQYNTELDIPILLSFNVDKTRSTMSAGRVAIKTRKADKQKRGQPKNIIPAFCPFCGEEYKDASDPAA